MVRVMVRDEYTGYADEMDMPIVPVAGQFIRFEVDKGECEKYLVEESIVLIYPGLNAAIDAEITVRKVD
jgi:hypothetical protein